MRRGDSLPSSAESDEPAARRGPKSRLADPPVASQPVPLTAQMLPMTIFTKPMVRFDSISRALDPPVNDHDRVHATKGAVQDRRLATQRVSPAWLGRSRSGPRGW